jgi:hypothetical protein
LDVDVMHNRVNAFQDKGVVVLQKAQEDVG